jgi:hypothetical protein
MTRLSVKGFAATTFFLKFLLSVPYHEWQFLQREPPGWRKEIEKLKEKGEYAGKQNGSMQWTSLKNLEL